MNIYTTSIYTPILLFCCNLSLSKLFCDILFLVTVGNSTLNASSNTGLGHYLKDSVSSGFGLAFSMKSVNETYSSLYPDPMDTFLKYIDVSSYNLLLVNTFHQRFRFINSLTEEIFSKCNKPAKKQASNFSVCKSKRGAVVKLTSY